MNVVLNTASLIALSAIRDVRKTNDEIVDKMTEGYRIPKPEFVLATKKLSEDDKEQKSPNGDILPRGSYLSILA